MSDYHQPVLVREVVDLLTRGGTAGGVVVDATLGGGGHSEALLVARDDIWIIGLDQDENAIREAWNRLQKFGNRFRPLRANFREIGRVITDCSPVGVLMDVGVSSHQFDEAARGFSLKQDGPLDMRMDERQKLTAKDIVNQWDEKDLADLFYELGEERHSRRIAREIVTQRKRKPITRTLELAELVARLARGWKKIHPATKVFQALRIKVNDELNALSDGMAGAWNRLANEGRLVVISFHSLEDRIVKRQFKTWGEEGGQILTKKPLEAQEDELRDNARSRSAKLRAIEKNLENKITRSKYGTKSQES